MLVMRRRRGLRSSIQGFSLVELMVGIAVGMFVVAAAALMTSTQLTDNRRLLLETQLQQDLRAAADIVARDLRRAGYWLDARNGVPSPAGGPIAPANPYGEMLADAANSKVLYAYKRGAGAESFGFRLDTDGVLRSCQSELRVLSAGGCSGAWQDLTDGTTVQITSFAISTTRSGARAQTANSSALQIPCPALCADGTTTCWPTVSVREFVISISGRSRNDAAVTRSLELSVRLRNDGVQLSSEAPAGEACPVS